MTGTEVVGLSFFWACAALAVAGAVYTVVAKNPIRGAMGLLLMALSTAGLYLALHAQFLAAVQLIVYAGAIVVLFLFVIMLLGPSATPAMDQRGRIPRSLSGALFAGAGIAAIGLLMHAAPKAPQGGAPLASPPADFGTVDRFGDILFSHALIPFELSSALLMVAIIGAVAVARGRGKTAERARAATPTAASPAVPLDPEARS